MDAAQIEKLVETQGGESSALVGILQEVQRQEGYLARKTLSRLSQKLDLPASRLYALATFYRSFSLTPTGRHRISVCLGTACHVRGGQRVIRKLEDELGVKAGETTADLEFTLETVNCLGACALGPVVVLDEEYNRQMTPKKVSSLIRSFKKSKKENDPNA